MNPGIRNKAKEANLSLMDYILQRTTELEKEQGIRRTIFAACPNSITVLRSALASAKRNNAPIKFAATLNQVDSDGGYTGMTHKVFADTIRNEARLINLNVPVIIAIDHGGPWLKDKHRLESWSFDQTYNTVKKSFEAAVEAGFDLIHVDTTIDINVPNGEIIDINTVAMRTLDLIEHTEKFRRSNHYPKISYEVGTEEVQGGLSDLRVFNNFLNHLKEGLAQRGMQEVWPCFVVGKVGTDLHTTTFDPQTARQLTEIASQYGSLIKGHYSDNVSNPSDYPLSGMGAANVGPEFTENEYDALMELEGIEKNLHNEGKIARLSTIRDELWYAVIQSGRWKKWLIYGEHAEDFYLNSIVRQKWLIKTGCRYIWEKPEVIVSRQRLYKNLEQHGIDAEHIVSSKIEHSMDKYFYKFNLVDLNDLI
jgi:D-tagatose-1,6-bisphosphate aldolase subunit GatZ/KbaZ